MILKMLFGGVISVALACGVSSLIGLFEGGVSVPAAAAAAVLSVLYISVFRAGSRRRISDRRATVVIEERPDECAFDEFEECFQPA